MSHDEEKRDFAKRLNKALDDINFPKKGKGRQIVLAELFGVTQHAARKWLVGDSMPSTKRLPDLAKKLNVSTEWLLSGKDRTPSEQSKTTVLYTRDGSAHQIPVMSWVQAGAFCDSGGPFPPIDEVTEFVSYFGKIGYSAYALIVQGDSMTNPHAGQMTFLPGSRVIVDPGREAEVGNYVVVRLPGSDEVTFKQLVQDGGQLFLKPLNPQYLTQPFPKDGHVCGVVVGVSMNIL
ncbi:LexA family protein [Sansalvadorimonas verongulae]|uniref:LexA family protein n=1 Tax=Sansalvadorimonas verongulae TaxID=2172824 RepID=UPI0012BCEADC|nr:S24 family peptidase [Sansalvadorimonas verongulae]MTI13805.1 helix-turn-helix domain-containing protein [Sansalvadorimonas verongulae]